MRAICNALVKLVFGLLALFLIYGCSSIGRTKPNSPFEGPYPEKFSVIQKGNPLLADEIGKLPEIIDGISELEAKALIRLSELYNEYPASFDHAFEQMYQTGKFDVRKYCSPLQALYWLLLDNKQGWFKKAIEKYNGKYEPEIVEVKVNRRIDQNNVKYENLSFLLDTSWASFKNEYSLEWYWKLEEARKVEESCIEPVLLEKIKKFKQENGEMTDYALGVAEDNPNAFTYKFDPLGFDQYKKNQINRWSDFNTVVERLNSPELVDKYIKLNFIYDAHFRHDATAKSMFKRKHGNCYGQVIFAVHSLTKAGYNAQSLGVRDIIPGMGLSTVNIPWSTGYYHLTTFYKDEDGYYILDNAWKYKVKGIHGPFKSSRDVRKWYK